MAHNIYIIYHIYIYIHYTIYMYNINISSHYVLRYIYIYIYIHIHIYVHIYIYICIHTFIYIVTYICTYSCIHFRFVWTRLKFIGCGTKHAFFLQVVYGGLKPDSNDSFWCVDMAIQRDFAVGVRKRRSMVEPLWH